MPIIDTHVHIWTQDPTFAWAEDAQSLPVVEAQPEQVLPLMQDNGVERAVLVQYIGYRWDNSYVAQALRRYPDRFNGVCRVNPLDPQAPDQLSFWTEMHGFRGVRLSAGADAGGDWITGSLVDPLLSRATALGVPVVLLTHPSRLGALAAACERHPELNLVIDHMADCIAGHDPHLALLLDLARFPRVYLKLSHIWVNSVESYPWRDALERVRQVGDVFGAQRIMWGSDWPMCLRCASYAQALSYLRDEVSVFTPAELDWMLGETALALWPAC